MNFDGLALSDWHLLVPPREAIGAAVASAIATVVLLASIAPWVIRRRDKAGPPPEGAEADTRLFQIVGSNLRPMTEPARAMIESLGISGGRLGAFCEYFSADCPEIRKDIEALVIYGRAFRHHIPRRDGTASEIIGEPRGSAAFLSIRAASEEALALKRTQAQLDATTVEARFLRDVLDHAPVAAWTKSADGQITWANMHYQDRFLSRDEELPDYRIRDAFANVLEEVPLTSRAGGMRRRVAIPGARANASSWFEISEVTLPSGETLGYALAADDLVAAEGSLRRFIETLTETFAHLPIGLAVFDKNRRLGLFNPALTDLVKIDAVWLAGRPSLRDFLERLRETRQMPDQKDFASWRRKLGELEEGARDGTYEENWLLPSGKIFRVTGRPHPQGALAFLFEDISSSILLERKYRQELELGQATLDRMIEAVAVFNMSGMLVFVNAAFEELWKLAPLDRLDGPGVAEITRFCAERCQPSPIWGQIAEFATAAEARTSWTAVVETIEGRSLHLLVAPLPDTSSLVVFRDLSAETAQMRDAGNSLAAGRRDRDADGLVKDLALEQLLLPAEKAVEELSTLVANANAADVLSTLEATAQALRDGLRRSRELRDLSGAPRVEGVLSPLASALTRRGLSLVPCQDAPLWDATMRRVAFALGLAAADFALPGADIELESELRADRRRLRAMTATPLRSMRSESIPIGVARRLVEAAGGSFRIALDGQTATLTAELTATDSSETSTPRAGVA